MPRVTVRDAIELAREAVNTETPFSLIRLGDGEATILGYPEHVSHENYMRVMRLFFGEHAQDPEITFITCNAVGGVLRSVNPDIAIQHIHIPGEAGREGARLAEWATYDAHYPIVFERVRNRLQSGGFDGPVLTEPVRSVRSAATTSSRPAGSRST